MDGSGNVSYKGAGSAVITVKTSDGGYTDTVSVSVSEAEKKVDEATRKAAAQSAGLTPEQALERMKAIYRGEA